MAKINLSNGKWVCDPLPTYWLIVIIDEVWYCMDIELEETRVVVAEFCNEEEAGDDDKEMEDTMEVNKDSTIDSVKVDVVKAEDVGVDGVAVAEK